MNIMPKDRDKYHLLPSRQEDARQQNVNYYFTGTPCKNDHTSIRNSKSGSCYECILLNNRIKKYSTKTPTSTHILELIDNQHNLCCICSVELTEDFNVDHCHKSGFIRGILCRSCNTGLGQFKDSPILLKLAIDYLSQPATNLVFKKHRQATLLV